MEYSTSCFAILEEYIYKSLLVTITAHLTSDEIIIGNINEQLHKKKYRRNINGFY